MKMKSKKEAKRAEEKEFFEASSSTVEFINFDDFLVFLLLAQFLRVVRFPTVDNFLLVVYILLCLFGDAFLTHGEAESREEGSRWRIRRDCALLSRLSHRTKYLQWRVADWSECRSFGDVGRTMLQL
jgi:hypothetical protein